MEDIFFKKHFVELESSTLLSPSELISPTIRLGLVFNELKLSKIQSTQTFQKWYEVLHLLFENGIKLKNKVLTEPSNCFGLFYTAEVASEHV